VADVVIEAQKLIIVSLGTDTKELKGLDLCWHQPGYLR